MVSGWNLGENNDKNDFNDRNNNNNNNIDDDDDDSNNNSNIRDNAWLTFAQRFCLVFSLSGFDNLSTKITTKREFRLSLSFLLNENT